MSATLIELASSPRLPPGDGSLRSNLIIPPPAHQMGGTTTAWEAEGGICQRQRLVETRAVWEAYVAVPPDVTGQDEAGRLWDIVWMTRFGIIRARPGVDRIPVALYVRNDNHRAKLIKLIATCGAMDIDDPQPAITVMMPDED